jgi:hypothetical protein
LTHDADNLDPEGWLCWGIKMTYWKADFNALVQGTTAIAKSISVEPATNNSTALYRMM